MSAADSGDAGPSQNEPDPDPSKPHDAIILQLLLDTYRHCLAGVGCTNNQAIQSLAKATGLSPSLIFDILGGKHHSTHRLRTLQALSQGFRRFDPALPADCFNETQFEAVRAVTQLYRSKHPPEELANTDYHTTAATADVISLHVPGYAHAIESARNIAGTYVTYRYAFELGERKERVLIAREVLQVYKAGKDLAFEMSFCGKIEEPDPTPGIFRGKVVPIGVSFFFVGFHAAEKHGRGRSLFIPDGGFVVAGQCNIGLLSGTRMHSDFGPCTATTLMFRTEKEYTRRQLPQFIRDVSRNEAWETLFARDFGSNADHHWWIRSFLDNRPAGAPKEKEFEEREEIDGEKRAEESTLRIDVGRFRRKMPTIFHTLLEADAAKAPFKKNWVSDGAVRPGRRRK